MKCIDVDEDAIIIKFSHAEFRAVSESLKQVEKVGRMTYEQWQDIWLMLQYIKDQELDLCVDD